MSRSPPVSLDTLLAGIMHRDDPILVPRHGVIPRVRDTIESAIQRIAYSYRKARGRKPVRQPASDREMRDAGIFPS